MNKLKLKISYNKLFDGSLSQDFILTKQMPKFIEDHNKYLGDKWQVMIADIYAKVSNSSQHRKSQ